MERYFSKNLRGVIDNFAFQKVLEIVERAKLGLDELVEVSLVKCPFEGKQWLTVKDREDVGVECFPCEKPVTEDLLAYNMPGKGLVIALKSDATKNKTFFLVPSQLN